MIRLTMYIIKLIVVLGILLWLISSWRYESPANIKEMKETGKLIFTSTKKVALDVAKEEIEKENE